MRRVALGVLAAATLAVGCADGSDASHSTASTTLFTDASEPGASEPSVTDTESPSTGVTGSPPVGFTTVTVRITDASGEVCEYCVWLADSPVERAQGLMGVTDLGEPVGMVFRFDELRGGGFWMFQTPTPLSIAWFGAGGGLVGTADMEPCVVVPDEGCPSYAPDGVYDLALEVFEGDLAELGIGPGSRLEIVPGTESSTCS